LRSACDPDYVDPGRTHGDAAEFYDAQGRFMGLAVTMGNGFYVPSPFEEEISPPTPGRLSDRTMTSQSITMETTR
jgi:hypothetical protein